LIIDPLLPMSACDGTEKRRTWQTHWPTTTSASYTSPVLALKGNLDEAVELFPSATYERAKQGLSAGRPLGRMVIEEEVARVVLFRASERSGGMAGRSLGVDVGAMMN